MSLSSSLQESITTLLLSSAIYCSPVKPELMDWSVLYPHHFQSNAEQSPETQKYIEFADIGCGYGGLLSNLFFF